MQPSGVLDDQGRAADLDHRVVPGRYRLAVRLLGGIPGGRDVGVDALEHRQHRGLRLAQPVTQLRGEAAGTADPQDTVDDEVGEVGLRQLLEDVTAGRDESVARTLVDPALPAEQHRPDIVGGGEGGPGVQGVTAVAPRADEQQHRAGEEPRPDPGAGHVQHVCEGAYQGLILRRNFHPQCESC